MWLFVLCMAEPDCCELGLQRGGKGHLGMKIRYPMECFNGKKMSVLRVSVFLWKSVIMQEEVRLGVRAPPLSRPSMSVCVRG